MSNGSDKKWQPYIGMDNGCYIRSDTEYASSGLALRWAWWLITIVFHTSNCLDLMTHTYLLEKQGTVSTWRCCITSIGIPIIKIRWSKNCLILYDLSPWWFHTWGSEQSINQIVDRVVKANALPFIWLSCYVKVRCFIMINIKVWSKLPTFCWWHFENMFHC